MNPSPHSETINHLQSSLREGRKLQPVFSSVTLQNRNDPSRNKRVWNARYLDIANLVEDKPNSPDEAFTKDKIELERFESEYTIFHFAQKYGSRIPADGYEDVSYFDDLRVEKARQACGNCENYLLVKGDFSGIQDFIYGDIPIENPGGLRQVSKKLRGKSFFVAVITDFFAEVVLERLGLQHWNLLFAGGGHFNLLAPWSEDNEKALDQLSREINMQLRKDTNNHLSMVLARQKCDAGIFRDARVAMEQVNEKRDALKHSQHLGYLEDVFFGNPTAADPPDFEKIGAALPKTYHLLQITSKNKLPAKSEALERIYDFKLKGVGKVVSLYAAKGKEDDWEDAAENMSLFLKKQGDTVIEANVVSLNNFDFSETSSYFTGFSFPIHFGYRLVGKEAPRNAKEELVDFEELAKRQKGIPLDSSTEEQNAIYPQLAVVRLDVDDLGCLFAQGLNNTPDLRHFAALSRELSLFFSGHFNHRAKDYDMYVVYSGGDDAFAVGNWACTMHFLRDLREDFKKFTGNNPDLHFSAGLFMCDEHFPVARFADEAGELEEEAKNDHDDKDRVSIFNHIMPFGRFDSTMDFGSKLLKYTAAEDRAKSERLSKGLAMRLLTLIRRSFYERHFIDGGGEKRKKGEMNVERFYAGKRSIHYLFARNGFDKEKTEKATDELTKEVIKHFIDNWQDGKEALLKDATVALHYAIYRKRKPKNS